jgi:leucyl-tRNA---protein transferase
LMFLKMEYSIQQGMTHFYPGYFAPNYPVFDYKLDLARPYLEFFELSSERWQPFHKFSPAHVPLTVMREKLEELSAFLTKRNFVHSLLFYEYFDAEMNAPMNGLDMFDFPIFIFCFETQKRMSNYIIVFDVISQQYHLLVCDSMYRMNNPPVKVGFYTDHVIQMTQHLFATESAEAMAIMASRSLVPRISSLM